MSLGCRTEEGEPLQEVIARLIKRGELSDSTRHRVATLLDMKWDADGYMLTKLSRLVKLVKQKSGSVPVCFTDLLDDLIWWNSDSQSVQRKWARAVFSNETTMDNTITEEME